MISRREVVLGVPSALVLLAGCSSNGGGGSAPSSKFKLSRYRIQLPVDDDGDLSGRMRVIDPAKTVKPWFIARDDSLEFVCPAEGATSPGSTSPRTELAENYDWPVNDGGETEGKLTVDAIPSGRMTVMQVWNADQLMRLSVTKDGLIQTASQYQARKTVGNYTIGKPFSYRVVVKDKVLTLWINGVQQQQYGVDQWAGMKAYFKAGAYCDAAVGTDPKARFQCTFTELKISH